MNNITSNRDKYIGGSDLPSILGLNQKYNKSIFDFTKEKAGIIPSKFKGNEYTRYGQLMEPLVRDYINNVNSLNFKEDSVIDEERRYRGNCDGIDRESGLLLEVKTFGKELDIDYYNAQCQFYMETFNIDKCYLVGYKRPDDFYNGVDYDLENSEKYFNCEFNENNIVIHEIIRDKEKWEKIEEQIIKFKTAFEKLKKNPEMTEDEFNNMFYDSDLIAKSNEIMKLENSLLEFKELEKKYKKLKDELYDIFEKGAIDSFETDTIKITRVKPTSYDSESIDLNTLKVFDNEIYEKYKIIKTINKKGYISVTKKGEK